MPEIRNLNDLAEYAYDQIERITRMQQQLKTTSAKVNLLAATSEPAPGRAASFSIYTSRPTHYSSPSATSPKR